MAGSLTAQQSALLAEQKQFNLQVETFQTMQSIESEKEKADQTAHDAILAAIESLKGQ